MAADSGKEPANTNRFVMKLTDGSYIVCLPKIETIPIKMSFADIQVPLHRVETLKLDPKNKTATLQLLNGDKLNGECPLVDMSISSALGDLNISMAIVTELATTLKPPTVVSDSPEKRQKCINNLRLIDHAKQQAATSSSTMTDSSVPSWDELTPFLRGGVKLVCPAGGAYNIRSIVENPVCTVPGHVMSGDIH